MTFKTIHTTYGLTRHGTPDRIDALATVAGGVLMASWLTLVS